MRYSVVICISTRHPTRRNFTRKHAERYSAHVNAFENLKFNSPVHCSCVLIARCGLLFVLQIKALHLYDCLRANKATSAWGVEARVPFLDKEFINVAMSIDPEWKMVTLTVLLLE